MPAGPPGEQRQQGLHINPLHAEMMGLQYRQQQVILKWHDASWRDGSMETVL